MNGVDSLTLSRYLSISHPTPLAAQLQKASFSIHFFFACYIFYYR